MDLKTHCLSTDWINWAKRDSALVRYMIYTEYTFRNVFNIQ